MRREAGEATGQEFAEPPLPPSRPAVILGILVPLHHAPQPAALVHADRQEQGRIQRADDAHVYLVEPARREEELERQHRAQGQDVERGRVGEDGVALHALKRQHRAPEVDLGNLVGGNGGKGVGQHRDENGEEEGAAEKGKRHHQRWADDGAKLDGALDARPVQPEPEPEEPFDNRGPVGWLVLVVTVLVLVAVVLDDVAVNEPLQREQKASKAPDGENGQAGKVLHHRVQGEKDDVLGHEDKGQPRQEHRCCRAQNVQRIPSAIVVAVD